MYAMPMSLHMNIIKDLDENTIYVYVHMQQTQTKSDNYSKWINRVIVVLPSHWFYTSVFRF